MDIKAQITKVVDTVTKDKTILEQFQKDPVKTIEKILGVDLPDDVVKQVVDGVKAKVSMDNAAGAIDAIKKLF
ncbi:MAG: hypothetical protein NC086_05530 [Alistipes sp.]|nr:hypothetical protein [Alistipes sp.]